MASHRPAKRDAVILLVEDNPADAELAQIGLRDGKLTNEVHIVDNGEQAMDFLHHRGDHVDSPTPDLVLLDLNLPGMDGREVLRAIKTDPELRGTPVVILTTSDAAPDVAEAYSNYANAYMTKPVDFAQLHRLMRGLQDYWFTLVRLPSAD